MRGRALGLALGSPIFPSGCEGKLGAGPVLSEEGKSACLSSCSGGLRPLVELCVEPAGLCGRCTGVLRCAGKAGNPFQTTQGNRLSCRDQEGRAQLLPLY